MNSTIFFSNPKSPETPRQVRGRGGAKWGGEREDGKTHGNRRTSFISRRIAYSYFIVHFVKISLFFSLSIFPAFFILFFVLSFVLVVVR